MESKLKKKTSKVIRDAQSGTPAKVIHPYSDELTAKEILKKNERKPALKKEELLRAMKQKISAKKSKKMTSKRTTPGTVPSDSTPAHTQREGKRWLKTIIKQNLSKQVVAAHSGKKK